MSYLLIISIAVLVSSLTFFSGFGLGILLLPAFAFFFPADIAVAATAVVHVSNNIFKIFLLGKNAHWKTVIVFGIPAVIFSFLGAILLSYVAEIKPIFEYHLFSKECKIEILKIIIALLLILYAVSELNKNLSELKFNRKYLALGGLISGFFGGLSGQQGALRAAFLSKIGLTKEQFIATSVIASVMVDITRISVYGFYFFQNETAFYQNDRLIGLIIVGVLAAFSGSIIGIKFLKKITLTSLKLIVGISLLILAFALGLGII